MSKALLVGKLIFPQSDYLDFNRAYSIAAGYVNPRGDACKYNSTLIPPYKVLGGSRR